jgi:type IV pilus assembly protein PilQ
MRCLSRPWTSVATRVLVWACALLSSALAAHAADAPEARVTLDVKEAAIQDVVSALAEAADLQVVLEPGAACRLTLSVRALPWRKVLEATLNACGLAYEAEGGVVRVATRARLTAEATGRRRLAEMRSQRPVGRVALFRLSYARAREMAPLIRKHLSDQGQVIYDERTNTLIISDPAR